MNPLNIAVQGLGRGALAVAVMGLLPLVTPTPTAPTLIGGGHAHRRPIAWREYVPAEAPAVLHENEDEDLLVLTHCIAVALHQIDSQ